MKQTIQMMAAPVALQPGKYLPTAYANRTEPATPQVELVTELHAGVRMVQLRWACQQPSTRSNTEPDLFPDAAALLVPQLADTPWMTMGSTTKPVHGTIWRAGEAAPTLIHAGGIGTTQRQTAPEKWMVQAQHNGGFWHVHFRLEWPLLEQHKQLGIAIWQGHLQERAGLKSVSPGWLAV